MNQKTKAWIIFTDGASSGNPGPGGWGAILVSPDQSVLELGGRKNPTTNNQMELTGAIEALRSLTTPQQVVLYTDSTYVIRGVTQWIWAWQKNGWLSKEGKPVANQELWKSLLEVSRPHSVDWKYCPGHSGIPGNERADEIAVSYSQGQSPALFQGLLNHYSVPILKLEGLELPPTRSRTSSQQKAHSYLSLVDGIPMRHSTWKDCESRVKGRSAAKYRKATSAEDEVSILATWGKKITDL